MSRIHLFPTAIEAEKPWWYVKPWTTGSGYEMGYLPAKALAREFFLSVYSLGGKAMKLSWSWCHSWDKLLRLNDFPKGSSKKHAYIMTLVHWISKHNIRDSKHAVHHKDEHRKSVIDLWKNQKLLWGLGTMRGKWSCVD